MPQSSAADARLLSTLQELLALPALDQLVREASADMATSAVPVHTRTPPNEVIIIADPDRLIQALENVIANANEAFAGRYSRRSQCFTRSHRA